MKAEADRAGQAGMADTGRNSGTASACAEAEVATRARTKAEAATTSLMEAVVERGNIYHDSTRTMCEGSSVSGHASHRSTEYPKLCHAHRSV